MNNHPRSVVSDDLDLRVYLEKILGRWPILCAFPLTAVIATVALYLLLPPIYEADALVNIPGYIGSPVSVPHLLLSDEIIEAVTQDSGMAPDVTHRISIKPGGQDDSVYRISVQADTAEQAAQEANTLADELIKWIKQKFLGADRAWLARTGTDLKTADQNLFDFLVAQGLNQYSLVELRNYEGMANPSDTTGAPDQNQLALSSSVSVALRELLRAQNNASGNYANAQSQFNKDQLSIQTNAPSVLNYAKTPSTPARPQFLQVVEASGFALAAGFLAGAIVILTMDWWKTRPVPAGQNRK